MNDSRDGQGPYGKPPAHQVPAPQPSRPHVVATPPLGVPAPSAPRIPLIPVTPQLSQRPVTGPQSMPRPATGPHSMPRPLTGPQSMPRPGSQPSLVQTPTYSPAYAPAPLPMTPPLTSSGPRSLETRAQTEISSMPFPREGSFLQSPRGSYAVQGVLGSGAFGAVYDCIGPFDQSYAVKMVRPANRPYAEVHAEWSKECARLLSLRHPNVVYIYDAFELDHLFYLALERCDHSLEAMLGTPLREGLIIELARQLLAAVQFLHDNDVVHDDLHAGNVLITHTEDRPQVKISDFGISHELRGLTSVRPNIVHHAIMAPEILSSGYTSRQSDLYQVGLLLYWMVTGEAAIDMRAPYEELVRVVAAGEPRMKAEALGTPLGHVLAKMLRRRESFRYAAAREVWADLRELDGWKNRSLFPLK